MSDPVVTLYVIENEPQRSTDQTVQTILRHHLSPTQLLSENALLIGRAPTGKPYLPGHDGLHISITHSGKWFVCAIGPVELGIDLQEHTMHPGETKQEALTRYCKIARRFFHPAEAAYVAESPETRFFPVWSAKESFVKYTGQGMTKGFDWFNVLPGNGVFPHDLPWSAQAVSFRHRAFGDDYSFCMCTPIPCNWHWVHCNFDNL